MNESGFEATPLEKCDTLIKIVFIISYLCITNEFEPLRIERRSSISQFVYQSTFKFRYVKI